MSTLREEDAPTDRSRVKSEGEVRGMRWVVGNAH